MKCPYCKKEISEKLNFCISCGKRISHCENCGKPVLFQSSNCVHCGAVISPMLLAGLPEPNKDEIQQIIGERKRREEAQLTEENQKRAEKKKQEEQRQQKIENEQKSVAAQKKALIVLIIIICVVAALIIVFLLSNKDRQTIENDNNGGLQTDSHEVQEEEEDEKIETVFSFENEEEVFYASNQTITPILYAENIDADISWSMANTSVATVDERGNVTSVARGETTLTAVSGEYTAQCHIVCEFSDVHEYELVVEDCTWSEAYQKCLEKGGHLVNINSQEEMNAIVEKINARNMEKIIFYVGGGRQDNSENYYWVNANRELVGNSINIDNQSWEKSMWMTGEPSYYDGDVNESYMSIFFYAKENRWVWNDIPNDITDIYKGKTGFICEFE